MIFLIKLFSCPVNVKIMVKMEDFASVHGHPEFLGAHPYPHCVLIFQVFLSTLAPTLPPKKPISGYKTFMKFGFFRNSQKILQKWMILEQ